MKTKKPNLDDVKRIVINRISVWDLIIPPAPKEDEDAEDPYWKKNAGGPGFFNHKTKDYREMGALVNFLLNRKRRVQLLRTSAFRVFREEPTYRWWKSGDTLNIVRVDAPRPETPIELPITSTTSTG